ncbi:MAG: L-2-amino-thiazoline-4-carboxylic acid hydrolase [Anaerolineaceae bacterium]
MSQSSKEIPMTKRFFPGLLPIIGEEKYLQVVVCYQNLYVNHEFPNNPGLRRHLIEGILPGLALYQVLRESGESQECVLAAIDQTFEQLFSDKRTSMKKLGGIPFFYNILRLYIKPAMHQYPADGWKIDWVQNDKNAIRFNMNSCFYFDTLSRYGAPELTDSFCKVDDFVYKDMSPKINWQRSKTIASGETICDFCFAREVKRQEK